MQLYVNAETSLSGASCARSPLRWPIRSAFEAFSDSSHFMRGARRYPQLNNTFFCCTSEATAPTCCSVSQSHPFSAGDSHDLSKLPLFDVNLRKPRRATAKTQNGKRRANADESAKATSRRRARRRLANSRDRRRLCIFPGRILRSAIQAPPCIGSDLLQRLNPEEHNKDKPSAIRRAAAYRGSAPRRGGVRRKPEIYMNTFVVS